MNHEENKQKITEIQFDRDKQSIELEKDRIEIESKLLSIRIKSSNLTRKTNLNSLADIAQGPLNDLFTDSNRRSIEIKISENDLKEFKTITEAEIKALREKSTIDIKLLDIETEAAKANNVFQLKIIEQQRKIALDKVRGDKEVFELDKQLQKIKLDLIEQEALILEKHVDRLRDLFAADIVNREILFAKQSVTGTDKTPDQFLAEFYSLQSKS